MFTPYEQTISDNTASLEVRLLPCPPVPLPHGPRRARLTVCPEADNVHADDERTSGILKKNR